jgi:hypothetical protein
MAFSCAPPQVRGFGNGALRPPVTPITDRELGEAIAEFLAQTPSAQTVGNLGAHRPDGAAALSLCKEPCGT